jgi:hypothetical protein
MHLVIRMPPTNTTNGIVLPTESTLSTAYLGRHRTQPNLFAPSRAPSTTRYPATTSFLPQKQKDAGEYGALGLVCDSRFHPTSHNTKMPPRAPDLTNLATLLEKYLHQVGVGSKEGRTPGEGSPLRRKTARSKGS